MGWNGSKSGFLGPKMGQKWVETHFWPTSNPFRDFRENPLFSQFKGVGNCFLKRALKQPRPSIIFAVEFALSPSLWNSVEASPITARVSIWFSEKPWIRLGYTVRGPSRGAFSSAGSIHHVMWSFLAKIWQKKPKIISLHDVLEPLKQALLASRDVIISSQICGSNLQKVFTLGDGCWLPFSQAPRKLLLPDFGRKDSFKEFGY